MAKTIALFARHIDENKPPFSVIKFNEKYFLYAYQDYLLAMKKLGAEAYFVSGNDTYLGAGRFSRAWTVDKIGEIADFREVGEIKADVVFEKGGFEGTGVTVVSDPYIRDVCQKDATYRQFGRFQPRTVIVESQEQLRAAVRDMPGDMVVVKNPEGSSGAHVYIAKKAELKVPESEGFPLLVQQYIDMSGGIPGLAQGAHDFRVLVAGGEIVGVSLREPAADKFHANTGMGASERLLPPEAVPAEVRTIVAEIDGELAKYPRYYSIDFARGRDGWVVIEMNTKPGLLYGKVAGPLAHQFRDHVARYIVGLA